MLGKNDFLYDKRLTQRFIKRGLLSRADYEAHINALEDASPKAAPLNPDEPTAEEAAADTTEHPDE